MNGFWNIYKITFKALVQEALAKLADATVDTLRTLGDIVIAAFIRAAQIILIVGPVFLAILGVISLLLANLIRYESGH